MNDQFKKRRASEALREIEKETQLAKLEWKNEFRKGRLMKSMFRNVCYLIMSLLLIAAVIITIMDIANKYDELLYDAKAEYSKCL